MVNTEISYRELCDRLLTVTIKEYEACIQEAEKHRARMKQLLGLMNVAPDDTGITESTLRTWMAEALSDHRANAH